MVPPDAMKAEGDKDIYFLKDGVLFRDADRLAFFQSGKDKPLWAVKRPSLKWDNLLYDGPGKVVALECHYGEKVLARVLRLSDGAVLADVPRPEGVTDSFVPQAMSVDGTRLAAVHGAEVIVFDLTGKIVARHATPGGPYLRDLQRWSGGWLLADEDEGYLFHESDKKWRGPIPFGRAIELEEIETPKGKRLLAQNYEGFCCLLDTEGRVLLRWSASEHGNYRAPRWNAVFAGGNALLRPTGWMQTLELVDLRAEKLTLTLHIVPVAKGLGWIAFTPDGWWDASPGAERHVAAFEEGVLLDEKNRDARRDSDTLRKRLAELWK
jgi:hypothetical protein